MRVVVARFTRCAEHQYQLRAVVGELGDEMPVGIDDPDMLLGVVRADLDIMRSVPEVVPLGPFLDDVAFTINDQNTVLPAPVDAGSAITWLFQPVAVRDGGARLPERQSKVGVVIARSEFRQPDRLGPLFHQS